MIIIGKEAYKITSALVVTLLATIGAALVITTTQTESEEILEKSTAMFNYQEPTLATQSTTSFVTTPSKAIF